MITKEEVEKIAKLARLGLEEKEIEKLQKELSSVLDYFDKLKKVDTSKIEPTTHSVIVENVYREDKTVGTESDTKNNLREAAPDKKGGFIKVKSIF